MRNKIPRNKKYKRNNKYYRTMRRDKKKSILRSIFWWTVYFFSLSIIGCIIFLVFFVKNADIPDIEYLKEYNPATTTRMHSNDGTLIAEYSFEKRIFIKESAIPTIVKQAFISAEDKNFFDHGGIDFLGFIKAIVRNITKFVANERLVGGSTITQQVAKNLLLTSERTVTRKLKEAILSFRIENLLSKNRILELYLNEIYLGKRAFGIGSAAKIYFSKNIDELKLWEIAYLAALPKAPNNYDPVDNYEKAVARRNWVLEGMLLNGYITSSEFKDAAEKELTVVGEKDRDRLDARYFVEDVRRKLELEFGYDALYKGGLFVHTTVNPKLQKFANYALRRGILEYDERHGYRGAIKNLMKFENKEKISEEFLKNPSPPAAEGWLMALVTDVNVNTFAAVLKNGERVNISLKSMPKLRKFISRKSAVKVKSFREILNKYDVVLVDKSEKGYVLRQVPEVNGALVAMDPNTGKILAMNGGWSYAASKFNRASQAYRQPGSLIKPFVYLAAMNNGFTPASLVLDAPFVLRTKKSEIWKPKNFSNRFYGLQIMRVGIEKSINLMTVRIANEIGMSAVAKTIEKFGIGMNVKKHLSTSLGADETTLMRVVNAFGIIVNGGKKISPVTIDRVQDNAGKIIYTNEKRFCLECEKISKNMPTIINNSNAISDPISTYQILTMIEGVIKRGTGYSMKIFKRPMVGKTGTTNDNKDAWFIASTPDIVVGAYIGFDNPESLGVHIDRGVQETGGATALPIVKYFYEKALIGTRKTSFKVPKNIIMARIDKETGRLADSRTIKSSIEAFRQGTVPGKREFDEYEYYYESPDEGALEENNTQKAKPKSKRYYNNSEEEIGTGNLY